MHPFQPIAPYIEAHLSEPLTLDMLAADLHYSKYHLHRLFKEAAGIPLHRYITRRRLTEAALALTSTDRSLVDIALSAGYESQQAFSAAFKAHYKRTPLLYRRDKQFYPLQLPLVPPPPAGTLRLAYLTDLSCWMDFLPSVIGGFPRLTPAAHAAAIRRHAARRQALLAWQGDTVAAAAAFSQETGAVEFLACRPCCPGADRLLLDHIQQTLRRPLTITTFREGDRSDPGQREAYCRLGFRPAGLLVEFGYPTQQLVLPMDKGAVL